MLAALSPPREKAKKIAELCWLDCSSVDPPGGPVGGRLTADPSAGSSTQQPPIMGVIDLDSEVAVGGDTELGVYMLTDAEMTTAVMSAITPSAGGESVEDRIMANLAAADADGTSSPISRLRRQLPNLTAADIAVIRKAIDEVSPSGGAAASFLTPH